MMGLKTLWEKEKMLVTSIFSFSLNVFKRLFTQGRLKSGWFGKELKEEILVTSIVFFSHNIFEHFFVGLHYTRICPMLSILTFLFVEPPRNSFPKEHIWK